MCLFVSSVQKGEKWSDLHDSSRDPWVQPMILELVMSTVLTTEKLFDFHDYTYDSWVQPMIYGSSHGKLFLGIFG